MLGAIEKRFVAGRAIDELRAPSLSKIQNLAVNSILSNCFGDSYGGTFYTHSDHLSSASWITDEDGNAVQHLQYLAWGEEWLNQKATTSTYEERYTFTGNERDKETGYGYHGARYHIIGQGFWGGVDPLSDKYPSISPYAYCGNNPIMLVDPDGRAIGLIVKGYILWNLGGKVLENFGGHKTAKTIGYTMQHPINAYKIGDSDYPISSVSNVTTNFMENIYNAFSVAFGNKNDFGLGDGTKGNAYRHALWQAIITTELGDNHAERIGNAHENLTNINMDTFVDLINNEIGQRIGKEDSGRSRKDLSMRVLDEFYNEGLYIQNDNGVIEKYKLTQEEYKVALTELNKKGNDGLNK